MDYIENWKLWFSWQPIFLIFVAESTINTDSLKQ